MNAADVTPLFPMSVNPVRKGVYMVKTRASSVRPYVYARWTGSLWALTADTPNEAAAQSLRSADCYSGWIVGWIGLAEEPQ